MTESLRLAEVNENVKLRDRISKAPYAITVGDEDAYDVTNLGPMLMSLVEQSGIATDSVARKLDSLRLLQRHAQDKIVAIPGYASGIYQGRNVLQIGEELMITRNEPQGRNVKPCAIRSHGGDCGAYITVTAERPDERSRDQNLLDSVYYLGKW